MICQEKDLKSESEPVVAQYLGDRACPVSFPSPPVRHVLHTQGRCSEVDDQDDEPMLLMTVDCCPL